jgi:hypothetical protein
MFDIWSMTQQASPNIQAYTLEAMTFGLGEALES